MSRFRVYAVAIKLLSPLECRARRQTHFSIIMFIFGIKMKFNAANVFIALTGAVRIHFLSDNFVNNRGNVSSLTSGV